MNFLIFNNFFGDIKSSESINEIYGLFEFKIPIFRDLDIPKLDLLCIKIIFFF